MSFEELRVEVATERATLQHLRDTMPLSVNLGLVSVNMAKVPLVLLPLSHELEVTVSVS